MLHQLQPEKLAPHGEDMASAVTACVHCGFCLPTCPTYRELGQEMDSPRGRIILMKDVLEGNLDLEEALPHIDKCLGCLACEPACPSGVSYRDLISPFRARAEGQRQRTFFDSLRRKLMSETIPYPTRFRWGARMARLAKPLAGLLPKSMQPMFDMLPSHFPAAEYLATHYTPEKSSAVQSVYLLTGCAQQVLAPEINRDTIEVLVANGIEVQIPENQSCCGALAWHVGDMKTAQKFAQNNLEAFTDENHQITDIVTTAAGCGSGMQEYGLILAGTEYEVQARELGSRVVDISTFLDRLDLEPPPALDEPIVVAYHDACHLANAQGIRDQPRKLLRSIPNLELVEINEAQICCGSAGTYNLDHPDVAASLGRQKAQAILDTKASFVVTGNIGCLTQLKHHLKELAGDQAPEIVHTISLLARAYRHNVQ